MLTGDEQYEFRAALSKLAQLKFRETESRHQPDRLFSLKIIPSFSSVRLWTVAGEAELRAECLEWRQLEDWQREANVKQLIQMRRGVTTDLEPTLKTRYQSLSGAFSHELKQTLAGLRLPVLVAKPSRFGIDGSNYEIKFSSGVQFAWWETASPKWSALEALVQQFLIEVNDSE